MRRTLTLLTALATSATIGTAPLVAGESAAHATAPTTVVASGSFAPTAKYTGSGTVSITKKGTVRTIRLASNFRADPNSVSLRLYLASNASGGTPIDLGVMKERGAQTFRLPASVNLSKHKYVIAWCASVNEPITTAKLGLKKR